jgi:hypothetical protein
MGPVSEDRPPRAERGAGTSNHQERKIFLSDKKQFLEEFAELPGMRVVELTQEISLRKPMAGRGGGMSD